MSNLNVSNSNIARSHSYNHLSSNNAIPNQTTTSTPTTPTTSLLDTPIGSNRRNLTHSNTSIHPLSSSTGYEINPNYINNNTISNSIPTTPQQQNFLSPLSSVPTTPLVSSNPHQSNLNNSTNLTGDENTLKKLIKNGNWNNVFKVADHCISITNNPLLILQYKLCRIISHVKMRNYKIAYDEIQGIGDIRDLVNCFETYSHLFPNCKGTMVPFSMRIIKAELSFHLGSEKYQLDALYALLSICKREIQALEKQQSQEKTNTNNNNSNSNKQSNITTSKEEEILFSQQLENVTSSILTPPQNSISNSNNSSILSPQIEDIFEQQHSLLDFQSQISKWKLRERRIIFSIVTFIIQKNRDFLLAIKILEDLIERQSYDIWVLSALGRIHLQMGNLKSAQDIFNLTDLLIGDENKDQSYLSNMNHGFLAIAMDQYPKAIEYFDKILKLDPSNIPATNNKCISMLYTCDLGGSLIHLENLLQSEKDKSIDETLIFNICSLYELASDKSNEKKKSIMGNIAKKAPDSFDFKVFKISVSTPTSSGVGGGSTSTSNSNF